jgi:acetyl esterase/lipase
MKRDAKRLRIVAIGLLCAVVGVAHGAHKPATLADYMRLSGPNPNERLSYGDSPYQFIELFQPRGPGPFPVVMLIHGGCFKNEYQGMPQMRGIAAALSSQGIAVWSIEYRGLDEPGGGYPGTFQDVYADTTPIELSPNGSHTVFINGEFDNFASPQDARDYADNVRRRGDSAETVVLPGAGNFDEVSITSPSWRVVLGVIRRAVRLDKK